MGSFILVKPIGIPDDVAEVHSFEGRIEQSEYVAAVFCVSFALDD